MFPPLNGVVFVLWSRKNVPNRECLLLWFQSIRAIAISPLLGLDPSATICPEADVGTNLSKFWATGLIQSGLIMLLATHGLPDESVYPCPVTGLMGLLIGVPLPVKSPLRSASDGTVATFGTDSGRIRSPW